MELIIALKFAAVIQILISLLNLRLVNMLGWKKDLEKLSLLPRQVFMVHCWFISLTLIIFAVLTWRFNTEMTLEPIGRWLACAIGFFWAVRTILQLTYYSSSHWKGNALWTLVHVSTLVVYGGMSALYLVSGLKGLPER